MARLVCPNCGRLYAAAPTDGNCLDCDLVRLVHGRDAAAGVASAVAHERGHRFRSALVLTGMAAGVGLGVAAATVVGFYGLVIMFALPMATGALVWGFGVVIAEVRRGIWPRRSRRQRVVAIAMAVGGLLGTGTCAGAYRVAREQHRHEIRARWVTGLTGKTPGLKPCFQSGGWTGRFELRWHRGSDGVTVTSDLKADIGGCIAKRAAGWSPPLADLESVTCSFVAAHRRRGHKSELRVHSARHDVRSPHPCHWQPAVSKR